MSRLFIAPLCAIIASLGTIPSVTAAPLHYDGVEPFEDKTRVHAASDLFVDYAVTSGSGASSGTGLLTIEGGRFDGGFVADTIGLTVDLDTDAVALDGNPIDHASFDTTGTFSISLALIWDTVGGTVTVDHGNAANAISVVADLDPATDAPGDLGPLELFHVDEGAGEGHFTTFGGREGLEFQFKNGIDHIDFGLLDMGLDWPGGFVLDPVSIYSGDGKLLKSTGDIFDSDMFASDFSNATPDDILGVGTPNGSAIIFIPEPTALSILGFAALAITTRRRKQPA